MVVQAVGGAIASMADTLEDANRGGKIMLGGIAFQLGKSCPAKSLIPASQTLPGMIILYSIMAIEYCVRYSNDRPIRHLSMKHTDFLARGELVHNVKLMLAGLALNTTCLFIRYVLALQTAFHG